MARENGKTTDDPEDMLGRIFIRHLPYSESPCTQLWSEVFSIYSAKSRHRHMSIRKKSEEDAMLALYRTDLQFLENDVFAQYRIYQHLFEYAYDRCHYYRVRDIFEPIEKKRRWKLNYTADHWSDHRRDEKKFLELAMEIDARHRLPSDINLLKTTLALQLTRDVFLALEWFDGYRHFQGASSHLQSWGQFKRDSYSAKEAELIIREFRKTFESFESLQDGKPSNWEYKTERKLAAQALGHIQMLCRSTWGPDSPKAVEYANLYRTNLKRLDKDEWAMLGMEVTEEEERIEKQRRREVAERRDRRRQRAGRGAMDEDQKEARQQETREGEGEWSNKLGARAKTAKRLKSGSAARGEQDERKRSEGKRRSGIKGLSKKDNVKRKRGRRRKWKMRSEGGKNGSVNGKNGGGRSRRKGNDASRNIRFYEPNCSGTCLRIQNQLGETNRVSSCPRATFSPFSGGYKVVMHRQTHESDNYSKTCSRLTFPHVHQGTLASR